MITAKGLTFCFTPYLFCVTQGYMLEAFFAAQKCGAILGGSMSHFKILGHAKWIFFGWIKDCQLRDKRKIELNFCLIGKCKHPPLLNGKSCDVHVLLLVKGLQ